MTDINISYFEVVKKSLLPSKVFMSTKKCILTDENADLSKTLKDLNLYGKICIIQIFIKFRINTAFKYAANLYYNMHWKWKHLSVKLYTNWILFENSSKWEFKKSMFVRTNLLYHFHPISTAKA